MIDNILDRLTSQHRETIKKYTNDYPVKLGALANNLGVQVKVKALDRGISGQISKEDGVYVIRVNRYETRERQRFTIAHELAHYFLHQDIIDTSGIQDNFLYRSGAPENVEFEANRLASIILMPSNLINEKLKEYGGEINDKIIEQLARKFEVSKGAMEIRLQYHQ